MGKRDDQVLEHPSYALVSFSRISTSGHRRLFGSSIPNHLHSVRLKIAKAQWIRRESGDQYYSSMRGDIIEVELSAFQFSELLTTMNIGMGVPCTIISKDCQEVESPPEVTVEAENIGVKFEDEMKGIGERLRKKKDEILAGFPASVSDKVRHNISAGIDKMVQEISDYTPYILDQFKEATGKMTQVAKSEVDALMTHTIVQMGMKALKRFQDEEDEASTIQQLPPAKEKDPKP